MTLSTQCHAEISDKSVIIQQLESAGLWSEPTSSSEEKWWLPAAGPGQVSTVLMHRRHGCQPSSPTSASSLPFGTALVHYFIHLKHSVLRSCPWRGHVLGPGVKRYLRHRVPPVAQQVEDLAAAARVPAEVWVQWPGAVS